MTLRTPRRRISPRTKRRYRAIKDFLRRALGSPSQPDIKINSSIAINVTDLKHKITGLEQQLSEVNKHCRELVYLDSSSRKESQTLVPTVRDELGSLKEETEVATSKRTSRTETKVLYKTSESHYRKSDESDSYEKIYDESHDKCNMSLQGTVIEEHVPKKRKTKKKSKFDDRLYTINGSQPNLGKRKTQTVIEQLPSSYSTNSYHSLVEPKRNHYEKPHPTYHKEKQYRHREYGDRLSPKEMKPKRHKEHVKKLQTESPVEVKHKSKSKRKVSRDIDQDFIAEIIKRQYKPMKMFKRESEISQFSAPVCRDQEYPVRKEVQHGSELCSCCCDGRKKYRYEYEHELGDLHSICDTRLYSSKKQMRHGHPKKHVDIYNDSELYDLIPVKEKASPKIRRKPPAEELTPFAYYKEVPPSPRTLRPRLNLKAQYYTEYEDYMMHRKHPYRNGSPKKSRKYLEQFYNIESETVSTDITECVNQKRKTQTCSKNNNANQFHQDAGTMSSLQTPTSNNDNNVNVTNETSFNKTQETISSDKTDKALSEIKDILQSFLLEIKKETVVSQSDNSGISTKRGDKSFNDFHKDSAKINTPVMPNSGHSANKFSMPQCPMPPYMPSFTNPCCYPILPVCPMNCVQNPMNCVQNPMNCLQNGYILPSTSFTCASCANNTKDDIFPKNANAPNEFPNNNKCTTETDELIKEIYKFVAQSPVNDRRKEKVPETNFTEGKVLTSRSVGGSSKASRHDAKVGTQKIRCYSKSCEAIGSRMTSDTYYSRTNPTYSDTVLERLSLEATASESEYSSESTVIKKEKPGRFAKVLKSFGLFKKKKDVIEELSESESTVEVDVKPKSPYRQELTDYVVHGEEYYNRPPMPFHQPHHSPYTSAHDYQGYHTPEYPRFPGHISPTPPPIYDNYYPYTFLPEHGTASPFLSKRNHPSAPPYQNPFEAHHNPNQPPLCLKEIEVKSIATQSERKMSFFRKLTKKVQGPAVTHRNDVDGARTCSTQTAARVAPIPIKASKLAKFNWKTLQAKMNELDQPENMTFSLKTQKKLAEGDIKMRNAMLKKLFYKRNPFSPRNLIVKTLLGKDKSSYGEPPAMYRPKMFF